MPPYRRRTLLLALSLIAALPAAVAGAPCEATFVEVDGQYFAGPAAVAEASATDTLYQFVPGDPPYVVNGSGYARITLVSRIFEAAVHADNSLYVGGSAHEEYRLVGAPAGTEITFRVRLVGTFDVDFYQYCGGSGCNPVAGLTVDGVGAEHLEFIGIAGFQDALLPFDRTMTLIRRAEEPFLLKYFMQAGTSHSPAYVGFSARVEFVDLPPGVRVASCLEDYLATPNLRTTWGNLKVRYR